MRGEDSQIIDGARFQCVGRGAAAVLHGGANAAACPGDLFVGGAGDAVFVFVGPAARENQMGVGIDEAGQNHFAFKVELLGFARGGKFFEAAARADRRDAVFVNQNRAIANDGQIIERFAAAGSCAAQGEQLGTAEI